jgi:hypothetical protein
MLHLDASSQVVEHTDYFVVRDLSRNALAGMQIANLKTLNLLHRVDLKGKMREVVDMVDIDVTGELVREVYLGEAVMLNCFPATILKRTHYIENNCYKNSHLVNLMPDMIEDVGTSSDYEEEVNL